MASTPALELNGINGTTGDYLPGPGSLDDLYAAITSRTATSQVLQDEHYEHLKLREERRATPERFGLAAGIDAKKLEESGWGVIFPFDAPPALFDALRPLLDHRKELAGKKRAEFYREFVRDKGHRPKDTKVEFLKRLGRAAGQPADPRRGVPYYLLIVGSPQVIPWRFQYELDVEYAVGRVHFETADGRPDYEAYHRYAQGVVLAETHPAVLPRSAAFFAPNHDLATRYSADKLIGPLHQEITESERRADRHVRQPAPGVDRRDADRARGRVLQRAVRRPGHRPHRRAQRGALWAHRGRGAQAEPDRHLAGAQRRPQLRDPRGPGGPAPHRGRGRGRAPRPGRRPPPAPHASFARRRPSRSKGTATR
jgi:hypothetical protein